MSVVTIFPFIKTTIILIWGIYLRVTLSPQENYKYTTDAVRDYLCQECSTCVYLLLLYCDIFQTTDLLCRVVPQLLSAIYFCYLLISWLQWVLLQQILMQEGNAVSYVAAAFAPGDPSYPSIFSMEIRSHISCRTPKNSGIVLFKGWAGGGCM